MTPKRQHKHDHSPFPPCNSAPAAYVPFVVGPAPNSALPTLPREDRQRLILFFKCDEDLARLAAELDSNAMAAAPAASSAQFPSSTLPHLHSSSASDPLRPLRSNPVSDPPDEFELQSWSTRPEIAAHIAHRRQETCHRSRKNAIENLEEVLKATADLIEKRRAASAILRTLNRTGAPSGRDRPTRNSPADSTRQAIASAYAPKPGDISGPQTPLPDPDRTPTQVLDIVLASLQNPDRQTAAFTLFNMSGHADERTPEVFSRFMARMHNDPALWRIASAQQLKFQCRPPWAAATYSITLDDSTTRYLTIWAFQHYAEPIDNCWTFSSAQISTSPPGNPLDSG